jgi:acyl-coenzyme A synthetase/AMP-(fatty) acid ligase
MTPINAAAILLDGRDPRRIALECGRQRIDYGALRAAVARAGSAWRRFGVRPGDRVAIKLADGIAWVTAYHGAIWGGAVAVAVNPRIPAAEWQRIVAAAGFRCVLAEATDDVAPVLTLHEWSAAAQSAAPMPAAAMDPEAPACWTQSSGTSGSPKAVVHAHRVALHVERVAADVLGVRADDRLLASSKMFFVYPLANSLFAGLKLGATVILDPAWPSPATAVGCVEAHKPTVYFSVPSLYRALLHENLAPRFAAGGVRVCVSAGEALPARVREQWQRETGIAIVNGYGASETMCLMLVDTGSGLRPAPGVKVAALNPAGDAPGRVHIRAPTLAVGYFERPDAQAEAFRDGGFVPGDLFERLPDGAWRFGGREDSLVKVRGRWVDLVELEEQFAAGCPGIAEAAAVAVADADGVTEIALAYAAAPGADAGIADAIAAHAGRLPPHRRPRWMHEVAALPRTPTGKLLRRQLRAAIEAALPHAPAPEPHER